jgi:fatty-acyl-CoA synthase/long-chain acyl-CoA synthetase
MVLIGRIDAGQAGGGGAAMHEWAEVCTIGDTLVRAAAEDPDGTALVLPPHRATYRQLYVEAVHRARALIGLGVTPGQRIGILLPNCPESIYTFYAAALIGAVTVPINTRYTPHELAHIIEHAGLAIVVTTDGTPERTDFATTLLRAVELSGGRPHLLLTGADPVDGFIGDAELDEIAATVDPAAVHEYRHQVRIRDLTVLLYTSGTTARPKGCMHSHEPLVRTGTARITERSASATPGAVWTPCPLFHVGALVPLIGCVATRSTFVTSRRFDPEQALDLLRGERVSTALPLFAAFTDAIMDLPRFGSTSLPALRHLLTTGNRAAVARAQRAFAPARLLSAYGLTEVCGVAAISAESDSDVDRLDWDGVPLRGVRIEVRDTERRQPAPPGRLGEIVARGYPVFDGYYRDPGATAAAFDCDGWFRTGDIGVTDEHGRIGFRGRVKDMLKVGGENVAAIEVEDVLSLHPGVTQAAVVGVPDARLDEVAAGYVSLTPGVPTAPHELIDFCRGRLASFKVPRYIGVLGHDEWPMSATKVNKVALRARALDEFPHTCPSKEST